MIYFRHWLHGESDGRWKAEVKLWSPFPISEKRPLVTWELLWNCYINFLCMWPAIIRSFLGCLWTICVKVIVRRSIPYNKSKRNIIDATWAPAPHKRIACRIPILSNSSGSGFRIPEQGLCGNCTSISEVFNSPSSFTDDVASVILYLLFEGPLSNCQRSCLTLIRAMSKRFEMILNSRWELSECATAS